MTHPPRVTLLTDFGMRDGYVAAMKGVIAAHAPGVIIDDVAHDIPPGDVAAAAWSLGAYWNRYPEDTVHVVVVDPGVGSGRRALAARVDDRFIVAPDNGTLTLVLEDARDVAFVELAVPASASATFHGRDIFAPAAARLAAGAALADIGTPVNDLVVITYPDAVEGADGVSGTVIHIDAFGNIITSIRAPVEARTLQLGEHTVPMLRTYSDVASGELVALTGSRDRIEVSVRDGDAARLLGVRIGDTVRVELDTRRSARDRVTDLS